MIKFLNRRAARALAAFALLSAVAAPAAARCYDSGVCIDAVAKDGYTELRGRNDNAFALTLKLKIDADKLAVDAPAAGTVLPPGKSVPLARLRKLEAGTAGSYRYSFSWSRGDYRIRHDDDYVYSLPFQPGLDVLVTQGYNGSYSHTGDARYAVDFELPEGTPLFAAREGRVVGVREDSTVGGPDPAYMDEANYIVIRHPDGTFGEYLHLQPQGAEVEVGQSVERGQLIGYSGDTGFSGGPHLHFMVAGAAEAAGRRSFPVQFATQQGVLAELQAGQAYRYGSGEPAVTPAGLEAEGAVAVGGRGR